MPEFAYQAIDRAGRSSSGVIVATAEAAAVDQILAQGLQPVELREQAQRSGWSGASFGRNRLPKTAAETFSRELGNLLGAGVPLARALRILAREASQPVTKRVWEQIHDTVVGGTSLADALAAFPQVFSDVNVAMVRAGEEGGFLSVVLEQIADFRARERDLVGKVKAAMIYPVILFSLMLAVMAFLLVYFIPKFEEMFADFGAALPTLTRVIMAASDLLVHYWPWLIVATVAAVFGLRRAAASDLGRRRLERVTLRAPVIGRIVSRFALVRFSSMLGTLLGAGVPLIPSLRTARDALGNQTLNDAVTSAIEQVRHGQSLSRSLANCEQLFPPSVLEIIAVAEETGRLDVELKRLAVTNESELDRQLRMLVALLEPLLLLVMAAAVGTIVVGMLLPIFTLQDLIK